MKGETELKFHVCSSDLEILGFLDRFNFNIDHSVDIHKIAKDQETLFLKKRASTEEIL